MVLVVLIRSQHQDKVFSKNSLNMSQEGVPKYCNTSARIVSGLTSPLKAVKYFRLSNLALVWLIPWCL